MERDKEALAERLFELRDERGWTQGELAERAGVNRNTVMFAEFGKTYPRMPSLRKIARALAVSVQELVHSDGQERTSRDGERAQEVRAVDS